MATPTEDGVRLAAEEAAEREGAPVEISVSDDQSSPQVAADVARKLADSDALAVIGPSLTISGMTTGPVFAEAGLASIVPTAHGDDVPTAPTTFQPIFNTSQIGAALANYLFYLLQGRRAVVLYTDDTYGRTLSAGFRRTAERLGVEATYHGFGTGPERAKGLCHGNVSASRVGG